VRHKCTMENKRSYEKESYKSKPTGIRFNLEQEKIALMRSKKKTRQQLVDFLLESYVKGENPIMERNYSNAPAEPPKPPNYNNEISVPPLSKPKSNPIDDYTKELKDARTIPEIEAIIKIIKSDVFLDKKQKDYLEAFGVELSKEMYTD